ncbi:hypothetical protein JOL62DRAFT_365181 [Phyllosticta paracitricarpa]|uniref:Uncharacterized protein n=1 Tax=Phyllosticta paracitricarpa TaxID=2016321 RepID=A0ABR1MVN0_9PEZI
MKRRPDRKEWLSRWIRNGQADGRTHGWMDGRVDGWTPRGIVLQEKKTKREKRGKRSGRKTFVSCLRPCLAPAPPPPPLLVVCLRAWFLFVLFLPCHFVVELEQAEQEAKGGAGELMLWVLSLYCTVLCCTEQLLSVVSYLSILLLLLALICSALLCSSCIF